MQSGAGDLVLEEVFAEGNRGDVNLLFVYALLDSKNIGNCYSEHSLNTLKFYCIEDLFG